MADIEQWVNLRKDAKLEEDGITTERMGEVRIKCKFEKANLAGFRVRIIPLGDDHQRYSRAERNRNHNFRVRVAGARTNRKKSEVELDKGVFLSAAGGNRYKIQAKYKKKVVESGKVVTVRRKIWYQSMKMTGIRAADLSGMEDAFWKPDKNYYVKLKKRGSEATVKFIKTLNNNDDEFIKASAKGYELAAFKPYAFGVVFVNYIAEPTDHEIVDTVPISVPSRIASWNPSDQQLIVTSRRGLWFGLVDADDRNKAWLDSCSLTFRPSGAPADGSKDEPLTIDRADVAIHGPDRHAYGGKYQIKVLLAGDAIQRRFFTSRAGQLFITLKVKVAAWTNGFAYNRINLAAIADKVVWDDQPNATKLNVINHEIGHKLGMVADGTGRSPDKPANHYTGRNHQGPHCSTGASWNRRKREWSGAPGCVMFGADGTVSGGTYHPIPPTFCDKCSPAVRKLDLAERTLKAGGFRVSMDEY